MRLSTFSAIAFLLLVPENGSASELEDELVKLFDRAIVKIDVSSNLPVFDKEGVNVCTSEGTGFLVSHNDLVTAQHVLALNKACGEPIIIVKSVYGLQQAGTLVASKDDVALLRIPTLPTGMCALRLKGSDVFDTDAIRFGIPGGLNEPPPPPQVRIGKQSGEFAPLVLLSPAIAEKGESGGPVIRGFKVVGMTRAKHDKYAAISLMTVGSKIKALLDENSIKAGALCNPLEFATLLTPRSKYPPATGSPDSGKATAAVEDVSNIELSVRLKSSLGAAGSLVTPRLIYDVAVRNSAGAFVVRPPAPQDRYVKLERTVPENSHLQEALTQMESKADDISSEIETKLWDAYVAEGSKDVNVVERKKPERQQESTLTGNAGSAGRLSSEQRTRITAIIRDSRVAPINGVNFAISVGTRVPRDFGSLRPLPREIEDIYPTWRGYEFFLVRDQVVVVDPRSLEIVAVLDA
jgi:hypothetical protein